MHQFVTASAKQTRELGRLLSEELRGGEVLCLEGDLGAGKTTFTQGLLRGLGAKGPYTSPTFVIMKEYPLKKCPARNIYHIDAYRIGPDDLLSLGWPEIIADPENITIVEWPERVKKILPRKRLKIRFQWLDRDRRRISFAR